MPTRNFKLNTLFSSKFPGGSLRRETPEEGRRIHRPKSCENSNKDEECTLNTLIKLHLRNLDK